MSAPSIDETGRLLIDCPDGPGIVAAVAGLLAANGANITDAQQHSTGAFDGTFFLRIEFHLRDLSLHLPTLRNDLAVLAVERRLNWRLERADTRKRVAIFVSTSDHALLELLWRSRTGDMKADIHMIVSNHADLAPIADQWELPFHHVPVSPGTRHQAEARHLELLGDEIDLIVLARYMQVLSPEFVARFPNRIINIHHSFLPAFVGAKPYEAAYARGVKLIGATAHYVTDELDAGPIIEQEVLRVDHRHTVPDLRRLGRDAERLALARAVTWHCEDRIIVHDQRTVVFT
jgi:formyltetrahydrofolate deformylase